MTPADPPAAVDLAREPDFWLGSLLVSPSGGRVRAGALDHHLEPRVMEVLVVLARQAGRTVARDQLIEACWGGRVVSDDAVNRVLAQVRGVARLQDPSPFVLETLPKVGVRLIIDGVLPEPAEAGPNPLAAKAESRQRPRLAAGAGLLAAVAAGAAVAWISLRLANALPQNGSVEVEPFEARAADPGVRQAAAEMPQELVRILSSAGVRTTQARSAPEEAREDAELRVTGSVALRAGEYLISGQIIDRRTGVVLFAAGMRRGVADYGRSPGAFTANLAAVLHCALADRTMISRPLTPDEKSLYLNACAGGYFRPDQGQRMLAVTRRLATVAPDVAGSHAMHAIAAAEMAGAVRTPAEAQALHAEADAAANAALKLNPRAAKAYYALAINAGVFSNRLEHDWASEDANLTKALTYDPGLPAARSAYASLLRQVGRVNEALEVLKMSDPADPRAGDDPRLAMLMAAGGDLEGAEAVLSGMEAHDGVSQNEMRWTIAFWWEDPKTALRRIRALAAGDTPRPQACFETYLVRLTRRGAGAAKGLPPSCEPLDSNWKVRMLSRAGDLDGAFAALEGPMPGGSAVLWYPEMRALRADPRFWPLVQRIGLVDYWRASGRWPDFCSEPGLHCEAGTRAPRPAHAAVASPAG